MNPASPPAPPSRHDIPANCGIAVIAMGLTGMAGWIFHVPMLVRLWADMPPMQFNTAAGFVVAGVGLTALGRIRGVQLFAGGLLIVLGVTTLFEYATGLSLFIDQILFRSWFAGDPYPGRMSLHTAGCFTVVGITFCLSRLAPSKAPVMRVVGSVALVGMAGAALMGHLTGMESVYRGGQATRMAPHTALGFLVVAIGLGMRAWRALYFNRSLWLAGFAGVGQAVITMLIWFGAVADQHRFAMDASRTVAANLAESTVASLKDTTAALTRFAERWEAGCEKQKEICERDLTNYFRDLREVTSLEWVERATGAVIDRRVAPRDSGPDPLEIWAPANKGLPSVTLIQSAAGNPRIILSVGRTGAAYFVAASLDPVITLAKAKAPVASEWHVSVSVDSNPVIMGPPSPPGGASGNWTMQWLGASWVFRLSPRAAHGNPSTLPDWILLSGMTIACFLAISAYLWQTARDRTRKIQELNTALETKVAERTSDLLTTNDRLLERESQLDRMFVAGRIVVWSHDLVSGEIVWHGQIKELLGLRTEETPDSFEDLLRMVDPRDAKIVHSALEDALAGRREYNTEYRVQCPNGAVRWLATQGSVTRAPNGAALRIEGVNLDIFPRKEAEIALRNSEQHIRQLANAMPQIVFTAKPNGDRDYYNQRWYDYSGLTREQSKGRGWLALLHADDSRATLDRWESSFATGEPFEAEYRLKRASDGAYRWHLGRAVPVRNADNEVVRWFGTATDIEDYKSAEAAIVGLNETLEERVEVRTAELAAANRELEETRVRLQSVLNAATQISIIATDRRGMIQMFNAGAEQMLQYRADEMVGKHTPAVLHDPAECHSRGEQMAGDSGRAYGDFEVLVDGATNGTFQEKEWTYVRKDGSTFDAILSVTAIRNAEGEIDGFLGMATDITPHKMLERALRLNNDRLAEQTRQAEEANRAKSDFLATMSHEIRTPMNAILGMADLLWESDLNAEQRPYVEVFRRAGSNLLALINDILDLSKIEAGHFELERVPFNIEEVVDQANELVVAKARVKGIGLMSRIAPGIQTQVIGDPSRLRQVLINLLGNAIKFTESGEIVVTLQAAPGDSQRIEFSVADTGIGIPADKLATIFDNFTQADSSITRRYGGTGLGLSISRRIVELMGGALSVTSVAGRGSTFSFVLALEPAPETSALFAEIGDLEGRRVLVLDDSATNRLILSEALSGWGLAAREFSSPSAALLELSRAIAEQQPYSLVIVDKCMPEMDGFTATARIREIAPSLPVIMLSSDLEAGDIARKRDFALNGYASKPVRRTELFRLVCDALGNPVADPLPLESRISEGATQPKAAPLRILVAEDAPDNRLLLQAYLKSSPHIVTFAEDGQAAVNQQAASRFDLILMDVQMPVMDGLTATKAIRARERELRLAATPIIALTANARPEDVARSATAGCDGHLTKPISKQCLLTAIDEYGRRNGHENKSSTDDRAPVFIAMPDGLEELVPSYLAARRSEVPEMLRLLAASDFERLRVLGHNLKGNGTPYGFPRLAQFGAMLEQSAKKRDAKIIETELLQLEDYLSRVELTAPSR